MLSQNQSLTIVLVFANILYQIDVACRPHGTLLTSRYSQMSKQQSWIGQEITELKLT